MLENINNNFTSLTNVNKFLKYDILTDIFLDLADKSINHNIIMNQFEFIDKKFYFKHLDDLITTICFLFYIYYFHHKGINGYSYNGIRSDILILKLINFTRNKFNHYDLTYDEYITDYIPAVKLFFENVKKKIELVSINIININLKLPLSI